MSLQFSSFMMKDFVYKQNPNGLYILDANGCLIPESRNEVVDVFLQVLGTICGNIVKINKVHPGRVECNDYLLCQALSRYSRDIFGELRLEAKINHLGLSEVQRENLSRYSDYGFKVDSRNPYVHRRLANLLYWLSILKPFAIYPKDNLAAKKLGLAFTFHNEYMCYLLSLAMLKPFNKTLTIHKSKGLFSKFLYDLHFRNLSRSSLEFFLIPYVA
ncbi:MAG: hypothetical protein FWB79_05450 [Treponema sp.]|nr:hypothetical protein [Treponema sp.]